MMINFDEKNKMSIYFSNENSARKAYVLFSSCLDRSKFSQVATKEISMCGAAYGIRLNIGGISQYVATRAPFTRDFNLHWVLCK